MSPAARPRPPLRIVSVRDEDTPALASFFRRTWDPDATEERVAKARAAARLNDICPGLPYPTFAAFAGDEIVGYLSSLPARFWLGGAIIRGWWAKGLMILPEFRNGPLGALLVRQQAKELPVLGSLAVNPPALRLFAASGLTEAAALFNRLLLLRPGNVVRRIDPEALNLSGSARGRVIEAATSPVFRPLAAAGADAAGAFFRLRHRIGARGAVGVVGTDLPPGVDRLWERLRREIVAGMVRDRFHFSERYGDPTSEPYLYVSIGEGSALAGLGVVRAPRVAGDPRLNGIKVAVLSEAVFAPSDQGSARALIALAATAAVDAGADALLVSGTHRALAAAARGLGSVGVPPNVRFLVRVPGAALPSGPEWGLTRGDGDADSTF